MPTARQVDIERMAQLERELSAIKARQRADRRDYDPSLRDLTQFQDAQARADGVYRELGMTGAPPPMSGEALIDYRSRLVSKLQHFSPEWKTANPYRHDARSLKIVEDAVYADALKVAADPTIGNLRDPTQLREVKKIENGVPITKFRGDPRAFLAPFTGFAQAVKAFLGGGKDSCEIVTHRELTKAVQRCWMG